MANTTNFNWETPDDTDLVKDGAAAIRTLAGAIDTSLVDLKGGTSGQILAKATNTDMDFAWVTNDVGDITEVVAGTGISGGGTSGSVTITNTVATEFDAKGDLVVGTGADTFDKLSVGTNGHTLVADSAETTGLKYVAGVSIAFNAQTAAYTLVAGDAFKLVTVNDTVSRTVTIPPSVFTAGQIINVQRIGTGAVPFAAGAGVTITSTGASAAAPTLRVRYSAASIICTASDTFTVVGDIA